MLVVNKNKNITNQNFSTTSTWQVTQGEKRKKSYQGTRYGQKLLKQIPLDINRKIFIKVYVEVVSWLPLEE